MICRTLTILLAIVLAGAAWGGKAYADNPTAGAVSASSPAGAPSQDLLGHLVGRWVLTGVIAGDETVHDVEAVWVLGRNYVRINETSREKNASGQPKYEASIFVGWLESAHRYVCIWLDNTEVASNQITCSAGPTPDSIPLEFRDSKGTLTFTNTFVFDRKRDIWEWRMANVQGGQSTTFGTVSLRRR